MLSNCFLLKLKVICYASYPKGIILFLRLGEGGSNKKKHFKMQKNPKKWQFWIFKSIWCNTHKGFKQCYIFKLKYCNFFPVKGQANWTERGNQTWYWLFLFVFSLLDASSFSLSISSGEPLLPCVYRGIPYLHGEQWEVDECTTCDCNNATTTCVIESCQPAFCTEPIKPDGECCFLCPFSKFYLLFWMVYYCKRWYFSRD